MSKANFSTISFWLLVLIAVTPVKAVFQVISQPGLYQLGENVTYSPAGPNDIIFQITASNVEFDLGNRFIAQNAANVQTGLIGIQVASGVSNVTIKGGSVQNIRGTGIQVLSNCSRITLDAITAFSCEERGIDFVGSVGNEITDSQIQNCKIIECSKDISASVSISLAFCNDLLVSNLNVDFNGSTDFLSNILLDSSNRCNFDTIVMRGNQAVLIWNGFFLNLINNCSFKNCLLEHNTCTDGTATGFSMNGCSNTVFEKCNVIGIVTSGQVNGFFGVGNNAVLFKNCLVDGLSGINDSAQAYVDFINASVTYINCIAQNNSSTDVSALGFATFSSNNVSFIKCLVNNQTAGIEAVGFEINTCTDTYMQGCVATRNNGAAGSFGVRSTTNTNPVFVYNIASRNGAVAADQFSGVAAGAVNNVAATAVNSAAIGAWTNLGIT